MLSCFVLLFAVGAVCELLAADSMQVLILALVIDEELFVALEPISVVPATIFIWFLDG